MTKNNLNRLCLFVAMSLASPALGDVCKPISHTIEGSPYGGEPSAPEITFLFETGNTDRIEAVMFDIDGPAQTVFDKCVDFMGEFRCKTDVIWSRFSPISNVIANIQSAKIFKVDEHNSDLYGGDLGWRLIYRQVHLDTGQKIGVNDHFQLESHVFSREAFINNSAYMEATYVCE